MLPLFLLKIYICFRKTTQQSSKAASSPKSNHHSHSLAYSREQSLPLFDQVFLSKTPPPNTNTHTPTLHTKTKNEYHGSKWTNVVPPSHTYNTLTLFPITETAAHESTLSLDPSISSLSNDKSIKSKGKREKDEGIITGKNIYYIDCKGLFGSEISLTFMHIHKKRKKKIVTHKRKKRGRNRQCDLIQKSHLLAPLFLKSAKGSRCVETLS